MKVYGMHGLTEIKNLTPHEVVIAMREDNGLVLPSEGSARVEEELEDQDYVLVGGLEIKRVARGGITGLPDPRPGVLLVVSRVVLDWFDNASSNPAYGALRRDLASPGKLTRNSEGQITGCECLISNGPLDLIDGFLQRDLVITSDMTVVPHVSGNLAVAPKEKA